jgi:hypothetical protein
MIQFSILIKATYKNYFFINIYEDIINLQIENFLMIYIFFSLIAS